MKKDKIMKIIKKVLSIIGYSLLALLVVMTIWLVIDKFIIKSPYKGLEDISVKQAHMLYEMMASYRQEKKESPTKK